MPDTFTIDVGQYKKLIDHYVGLLPDVEDLSERSTYLAYIIESNKIIEEVTGEPYIELEGEDDPRIKFRSYMS